MILPTAPGHFVAALIMMTSHQHLPPSGSLPLDPNIPAGNAWGLFSSDNQLGMLNLLTLEIVTAAAQEIRTGVRVSLD